MIRKLSEPNTVHLDRITSYVSPMIVCVDEQVYNCIVDVCCIFSTFFYYFVTRNYMLYDEISGDSWEGTFSLVEAAAIPYLSTGIWFRLVMNDRPVCAAP